MSIFEFLGSYAPFVDRRPPFHESASVYRINGKQFVCPIARTKIGIGKQMEIVLPAPLDDPLKLGEVVIQALTLCVDNVPDDNPRSNSTQSLNDLVKAGGEKSWRSFQKKVKIVDVHRKKGTQVVKVTPMERHGTAHGYVDAREIECSSAPLEVGEAIQKCFEFAQ